MAPLELGLLGGFRGRLGSGAPLPPLNRKVQALLAYLCLSGGHTHPRDKLATLLWGGLDESRARGNLRQALEGVSSSGRRDGPGARRRAPRSAHSEREDPMGVVRLVAVVAVLAGLVAPAGGQDRARTKEVIVGLAAEPRSILPNTIVDWTTNSQVEHIYDRLVDRDPKTYKPAPMLATGWKVVNDTTWEFALRQGVKFHNGEPFNAHSVKATMDYIKDPAHKTHYLPRWAQVKEVQVVNDYTVRFVTTKPWPGLIDRIAATDFLPMPPKMLRDQGVQALVQKPTGTGPFKFVQWARDERLVLERNPDYWQGAPDVHRVTFRYIPEFSARLAALLAGEIDIMKDVPPHAVEMLDRSGRGKVRSTVSSRINYLALVNLKPGPMQDLRVRKAINHAVNVDELIQQVLRGRATRMCGPLSPVNADYASGLECYKHDPARAQALFKEAGVDPAKLQLTLDSPSGRYPLDKDVSLAIAAQLQRLGIKVNVVVNEWGTHLDKIKNRTTGDMFFLGWGPALDGQGTIEQLFQASPTYSSYGNNKAIDEKIAQAVTIVDAKKRLEAWAELQRLVHAEAPWVFLWQQHDLYGVASWIEWTPRADEKLWMYEAKIVPR